MPDTADVCPAILAGGFGTRLRPAVADRPKVLAPVGGRPFLAYLIDRLLVAGFRETVLLVGYGAGLVREAFGDRYGRMRLLYSVESEPLGTGGAVRLARSLYGGRTVLLMNGDSYCDADLIAFYRFHERHGGGMSLCLTEVADAGRYGRVETDGGRVVRFEEKRADGSPGWVNAGVYLLDTAVVDAIPTGRPVSLERECLPGWVAGGGVNGYAGGGRFIDIGLPEAYRAAEAFFRSDVPLACG